MQNKVSILTPFYNESWKILKSNIDSVKNQKTKFQFQHVVVVDNPKITFEEFRQNFPKEEYPHLKIIFNEENKGLCQCRNIALKNSTGEYVMLLDADDSMVEGRIEDQITFMIQFKLDHSFGGFIEKHGEDERIGVTFIPEGVNLDALMRGINTCPCGSNCFKKDLVYKIGYFDLNLNRLGAEDLEYWIRISKATRKIGCMHQPLYYLGIGSDNMTARYLSNGNFKQAYYYISQKHSDFNPQNI